MKQPDYELVKKLSAILDNPVIGEGRIHSPEQAVAVLEAGAFAVVVGERTPLSEKTE